MEEHKAIMALLHDIDKKVDSLGTHAEYTKKGVEDNKTAIEAMSVKVDSNTSKITAFNEWKEALDKIIWEILKPPLKFVGLAGFVIVCIVGGWLVFR